MKRMFIVLAMAVLVMVTGCASTGTQQQVDMGINTAFVALIVLHPEMKPEIVARLTELEDVLKEDITYKEFLSLVAGKFSGKYAPIALLLVDYFNTDTPVFEDWMTLFDGQREAMQAKIAYLKQLASV